VGINVKIQITIIELAVIKFKSFIEVIGMKINGVSSSKIISLYNDVKKTNVKKSETKNSDSITISDLGKSLSALSNGEDITSSSSKIEAIQKEVSNGTYNRNSTVVAKKMIDIMKNKGV
jgi:negative regulator of flagellin synthesis FlgM